MSRRASIISLLVAVSLTQFGASTARASSHSSTLAVLYTFTGNADGGAPYGSLLLYRGNIYGTTSVGGDMSVCSSTGCGTVYKIDSQGNESVIHAFSGPPTDGSVPVAGLIRDSAGDLFGTTKSGGANDSGTVFEIDAQGVEHVLYSFCPTHYPYCPDGSSPVAALIMDRRGDLFGTTLGGGSSAGLCDPGVFFGCGLVFEVQPGIGERTLYQFTGAPDGMGPDGPLIRDAVGNLYGTTGTGGINSAQCGGAYAGCGTIYRLSKTGKEMIIHRFRGSDGDGPSSSLMENASGTIVGTTLQGGQWNNGVVYTIGGYVHPSLVLHSFNGSDGSFPEGGLTLASSGNFFGTTNGGDFYQGNVFEMTPNGQETILVSFTGRNGAGPTGTLVADKAGNLYGVAATGGARLQGEVFRVTP